MPAALRFNKAVVLGAGGFLGVNLVAALVAQGFEVVCFDKSHNPNWPVGVTSLIGDLSITQEALVRSLDKAFVFHLASSSKPNTRTDAIAAEVNAEILPTVRLLELSVGLDNRWIYVSSGGTVYGQSTAQTPVLETYPTEPISSYGVAKLTVERYFALYKKIHATDYSVARVGNPYGPWQSPFTGQGIIATLIYKALTQQPIEIWGDGENIRDYLHVDDVVGGVIEIAQNGHSGEAYNLGSQLGVSVNQLVLMVENSLKIKLKPNYIPAKASDVRYSVLNIQKLKNLGTWHPATPLSEGVDSTVQWMRSHLISK
jgi:UDP-glucose 4-epimerase